MKRTVYLPDDLDAEYAFYRSAINLSGVVQRALREELKRMSVQSVKIRYKEVVA